MVILIAGLWIAAAYRITDGGHAVYYDTFHDMAYAENIRAGRLWDDPTIAGYPYWYAPGNPMLMGALSAITGHPAVDLYRSSVFWLNCLNPVLLFLLVRQSWDRATALLSLAMVGIGSYWWLTHAAAPMPSIQGVAFNLAGLMCWSRCGASRWWWPILTGIVLGLSAWHHPLCALVLGSAILLHGILWALRPGVVSSSAGRPTRDRLALLLRGGLAGFVALVLAAPLVIHLVRAERINLVPMVYFAWELHEPNFALQAHAPLVVALGIAGIAILLAKQRDHAWPVAYLLVGIIGEAVGYLAYDFGWRVPYLLPHEFQWHAQLGLGICAAVATTWSAEWVGRRVPDRAGARALEIAVPLLLTVAALAPALSHLTHVSDYIIRLDDESNVFRMGAWIRDHTPSDATLACAPKLGYVLAGLTGRKCVAVPAAHMNPAIDAERRLRDLDEMISTTDEDGFVSLAQRYHATYFITRASEGEGSLAGNPRAHWRSLVPEYPGSGLLLIYRIVADGDATPP